MERWHPRVLPANEIAGCPPEMQMKMSEYSLLMTQRVSSRDCYARCWYAQSGSN